MGGIDKDAAVVAIPGWTYVISFLLLELVVVLYADLLVGKRASASMIVLSII
jgi:hypothetical protein